MTTSLSNHRRYASSEGQPGSVVWFISFGDLLTLLLCFFLVLTPWDRLKSAPKAQSLPDVTSQPAMISQSGTTFASDPLLRGSVVKLEFPILVEEVGEDGVETFMLGNLEQDLRGAIPHGRSAEILVCSSPDGRSRLVHEVEEMFQRSDGGLMPRRFVVSRACDMDQILAPVTKRVVGRVRITGM